ncbi:MAG: relaxase/mobilization nuclease domain-containing protein [Nitrospira sp.]|nr:relaxase/mobilization nuclease domain-containing protein [Nitrospira sp.]
MIVKGGSRRAGGFFAKHLMNAEDNERVEVKEMRGFVSEDVKGAFQEIDIIAAGTRVQNPFYHASINPRADEHLTQEEWNTAVDTLEKNLGLEGHARFQIEHVKEGREHRHIIWNRLDENLKLTSDSFTYQAHDKTRRELEQLFEHERTPDTPQPSQRKSHEFAEWEQFRGSQTGITPQDVKGEITALYHASDSGAAFQSALEESGYVLCRGDKRDTLCVIDSAGTSHALVRRIDGIKTAQLRELMADIDPQALPSVKEATEFVKAEAEDGGGGQGAVANAQQQEPEHSHNPKLAVLEKYAIHQNELAHSTAQEFSDQQESLLARQGWQLPHLGTQTVDGWLQRGYESLEEQHAAIPEVQHHPPNKQPHESWSEFVTRTGEPKRTEEKEREPEIEL